MRYPYYYPANVILALVLQQLIKAYLFMEK